MAERAAEYYMGHRRYRVKDKQTGHETTIGVITGGEVDTEVWEILDKPALDSNGVPLPGKPNVPKSGIPTSSASSAKADKSSKGRSA